jgi:hypothetical protein
VEAEAQASAETQAAQDIQWVTCAISLQPQAPLTSAAELSLTQIALPAGQISDITITLKTNATVIEPLTLNGEAELSGNGVMFQLLLTPQVNFNRDDQVNIEVAVTGPAAAQPEPIGTVILPALPALRANTPLSTVLTLRPLGVDPNGHTQVRLTAQWISDNSIPGEFMPGLAMGLPVE